MAYTQGLSNESNKVTQAACMRDVVQETTPLEYLKYYICHFVLVSLIYQLYLNLQQKIDVKLPILGIISRNNF